VTLETFVTAEDLYLYRGGDVNPRRPLFTGDVFQNLASAPEDGSTMAMIIAHPCTFRGANAQLGELVSVVSVLQHERVGPGAWTRGHFDKSPLPELTTEDYVGRLDHVRSISTQELQSAERIASLSAFGINLLQQRIVWHLTRTKVETYLFHEANAHNFEEADLLEEWNDDLCSVMPIEDSVRSFDEFLGAEKAGGGSLRADLREAQLRSAVRTACRAEARRLLAAGRTHEENIDHGRSSSE
jgi:hypothetical protein